MKRPYVCIHVKKGRLNIWAITSYGAAQEAAKTWKLKSTAGITVLLSDVAHSPADV